MKVTHYDYELSRQIAMQDGVSFYGALCAVIRLADSDNAARLRAVFPDVVDEFQERYNNPGGLSDDEYRDSYSNLAA